MEILPDPFTNGSHSLCNTINGIRDNWRKVHDHRDPNPAENVSSAGAIRKYSALHNPFPACTFHSSSFVLSGKIVKRPLECCVIDITRTSQWSIISKSSLVCRLGTFADCWFLRRETDLLFTVFFFFENEFQLVIICEHLPREPTRHSMLNRGMSSAKEGRHPSLGAKGRDFTLDLF